MTALSEIGNVNGNSNATTRWATFGPYYAMFPIDFAFQVINDYSAHGDYVIDPFAGRFSAIYAASVLGRNSLGIEINPVGWLYGKTKTQPADETAVNSRLAEIYALRNNYESELSTRNEFFRLCFCDEVLKFLLAARENLDWKRKRVDATLMSIILVNLHGKLGESLSNQMRQTKAMSVNYSIAWWKSNGYSSPPQYNPLEFLREKIAWRYKKGIPSSSAKYRVLLGDSTKKMNTVVREANERDIQYSLLFTSPPYQAVVNYHADQWLRLWLLNEEKPSKKYTRRFDSKDDYVTLLDRVFGKCSSVMKKDCKIFVRTDVRPFTLDATMNALTKHFPKHKIETSESVVKGKSQTELFNNVSKRKEVDIIMSR